MTESTLAITYTELKQAVAKYLGHGMTVSAWSANQVIAIDMAIRQGLRQFYFPPQVYQDQQSHKWSFLTPVTTLETVGPYSTGTVAITNGATTMTLTDGVWPAWTATHGSIVIDSTEYVIASRTNDTVIELSVAWAEDTETVAEYVLKHDGNYDLPDDFAGIVSELIIESQNYETPITIVGEGVIRNSRQQDPQNIESGTQTVPYYAAVRPKAQVTTAGQRFEIMFYPLPSDAYTISYAMRVLPEMLVDTSIEYPYGGASHSNTILASCLAAAEVQIKDGHDLLWTAFKEALTASITIDNAMNSVQTFGYNGDNSDAIHRPVQGGRRSGRSCRRNIVTYDGG